MNTNIITDVFPFDCKPVELGHGRGVTLMTGSTSGFPVFRAIPNFGADVDGSRSETEPRSLFVRTSNV